MNWYLEAFKNYANFNGRARRKALWMFILLHMIVYALPVGIDVSIGSIGVLSGIYSLAALIPSISVQVRRLHDVGRSGWWLLISFVPVVGAIVLLVFFLQDSAPGENQYGENPKNLAA